MSDNGRVGGIGGAIMLSLWFLCITILVSISILVFSSFLIQVVNAGELDDARATARKLLSEGSDDRQEYKDALAKQGPSDQIVVWVCLQPDDFRDFRDAVTNEHLARARRIGRIADTKVWHVRVGSLSKDSTPRVVAVTRDGNTFWVMPRNLDAERGKRLVSYWWGPSGRVDGAPQAVIFEEVTYVWPQQLEQGQVCATG